MKTFNIEKNMKLAYDKLDTVRDKIFMEEILFKIKEDILEHNLYSEMEGQKVFEVLLEKFIEEDDIYYYILDDFSELLYKYIDKGRELIELDKQKKNKELILELSKLNIEEFSDILLEVQKTRFDNKQNVCYNISITDI